MRRGTTLDRVEVTQRVTVLGVGRESVDRLGRERDQLAIAQELHRAFEIG